MKGWHRAAIVVVLLLYWWLAMADISAVPLVHEDEPWIAATSWNLAREGVFGGEMFTGLYGMESKTYVFMPVFPLVQSAVLWGAGLSVLTVRYLGLLAGAVTMALTFYFGRRHFSVEVGLLAAVLLVGWSITGPLPNRVMGIPLLDTVKVARYDALVPVFGLLAWAVYGTAVQPEKHWRFGLAGLLTGLAGLTHVYGIFWLVVLLLLAWRDKVWRLGWPWLVAGCAVPLAFYGLYILSGFESWQQQLDILATAERFSPFDPLWYGRNLWREPLRYLPTLAAGSEGLFDQLRPGRLLLIVGGPAAAIWLGRSGGRNGRKIVLPLLIIPLLLGLLIAPKVPAYLMVFWPVIALALAVLVVEWGVRAGGWRRLVMVLVVGLVLVEGGWRLRQRAVLAEQTSAYDTYIGNIESHLPPEGLVLGLQRTWLGLAEREYRTWAVPLFTRKEATGEGLVTAVDNLNPAAVLIDADMAVYFNERQDEWEVFEQWLEEAGFGQAATVDDRTYGRTAVYVRLSEGDSQ